MAAELWRQQRPLLLAALVGVEASAWLHLIQDGDPMPRTPRLLRRRGRRRQGGQSHGNKSQRRSRQGR
jgi:uncharacterized metal-binding protein